MKSTQRNIALCVLLGASLGAQAAPVSILNGDFEDPFLNDWSPISGGGTFFIEDINPGGNPDTYASIDHEVNDGGFGILISNSNDVTLTSSIGSGLDVGRAYTFSVDMRIFDGLVSGTPGPNIGGFKVDFFNGAAANGSTGDTYPTLIGTGATWENYTFEVTLPSGTDGIKVVLLWGEGTVVGFDNVQVDDTPIAAPTSIPNGDFEIAAGDGWGNNSDGGTYNITFPTTLGNPTGHARIENLANDGGFGVLVANGDGIMPISELGLSDDNSYTFSQDMKIFSGANIGGLKVDFFNGDAEASSTGNLFPALIGTGATWETYDFDVAIPPGTTGIKVVALWGAGSDVGYDNVTFDPTPLVVAPITEIPNGDFETPSGDSWLSDSDFGTFAFSYPATGGNPNGYGLIDHSANDGGFGVLISNGGVSIPISGLGLTAGESYTFSQDMKIFSGSNIGGLKVEFFTGATKISDTGDMFQPVIAPGTSWQTYDFEVTLPVGTDRIKVVPLWGAGSNVGFDNITFDNTPIVVPAIANADFELGSSGWAFFQSNTTGSFPATGGNPNGHGRMDNTAAGWGVLVANSNGVIPLAAIGASVGETVTFRQDMKIFSGANIGALKVEFFTGATEISETVDMFPTIIGTGSTWETYTFDVVIPAATDGIKIVLVAGALSDVGFDNVGIGDLPTDDYAAWIGGFPGVGGLAGFDDDADGDGNGNGLENFFGTDPSAFSGGLTAGAVTGTTFVFTHPENASPASDVSGPAYTWSTDLQTFYADGAANGAGTTTVSFSAVPGGGTTTVTATITGSVIPSSLQVRVGVTQLP